MTRAVFLEKAGLLAPAFFLALAAALGGLRSDSSWLVFAGAALAWSAASPGGLSAGGLRAPALFFAWLGAAALFSPEPAVSLAAFSKYALPGLFFFLAPARGDWRVWMGAVCALGAAAGAVFIIQRLSGAPAVGFIGANPNYSAAFCAAAFGPAVLALSGGKSAGRAAAWGLLALLLAAGLAASASRGAGLAAFVSAAAGLGLARRWRWLAGLAAGALAAAAVLPAENLAGLLKLGDPRAFARPQLWAAAWEAALASPLLGWGPGLFGSVFEQFKFPYFDGLSYYGHSTLHAHSEVLNLAAEAGLPAAVLFVCAAGAALLSGWRERLPLKLCALAVLLQGSGDMIFYSGAVGLLAWGSLGFSLQPKEPAGGRRLKIALAALCLAGLAVPGYAQAPGDAGPGEQAAQEAGTAPAVPAAVATSSAPARPELSGAKANGLAYKAKVQTNLKKYKEAAALWTEVLTLRPDYYPAYAERAYVLQMAGQEKKAAADFIKAFEADPEQPRAYLLRGAAACADGKFDRAAADLEKALLLEPKFKRDLLYGATRNSIRIKKKCK